MSLFELLLIGLLAVYRLTFMLNSESGPADIFGRFRTRIGVKFDEHSRPYANNWFAEGVLCFYCLSVSVAFGAFAILGIAWLAGHVEVGVAVLFPFALSGGAIYLKKVAG